MLNDLEYTKRQAEDHAERARAASSLTTEARQVHATLTVASELKALRLTLEKMVKEADGV